MAYDEKLATRIRELAARAGATEEKHMFGGVCWLVGGNMAVGIVGEDIIVRVGPDAYEEAMSLPHTREFDFTGRAMAGWVMVGPDGTRSTTALDGWVRRGAIYAGSLPAKAAKAAKAAKHAKVAKHAQAAKHAGPGAARKKNKKKS